MYCREALEYGEVWTSALTSLALKPVCNFSVLQGKALFGTVDLGVRRW